MFRLSFYWELIWSAKSFHISSATLDTDICRIINNIINLFMERKTYSEMRILCIHFYYNSETFFLLLHSNQYNLTRIISFTRNGSFEFGNFVINVIDKEQTKFTFPIIFPNELFSQNI